MFRIAICDDLSEEREKIRLLLKTLLAAQDIPAEFTEYDSGNALLSAWESGNLDVNLIFLDICMNGLDGVETAHRLRDTRCGTDIIFLTTTPDFAIEGYEVEAAGYLLKPLEEEKLCQLLERLFGREDSMMLTLRQGNSVYSIVSSEIVYIESSRNRLTIHTVRETIPCYGRLDELACRLSEKKFLRCHQSFLVNMDRIYAAEDDFHMETGEIVPIRVRERRGIKEAYFRYITEKNL